MPKLEALILAWSNSACRQFELGFLTCIFTIVLPTLTQLLVVQDQKKFQEQTNAEQETAFTARPSPARPVGTKKAVGSRANGANGTPNRRLSLNAHQNGSRSINKDGRRESMRAAAPLKEDATSCISGSEHLPSTP